MENNSDKNTAKHPSKMVLDIYNNDMHSKRKILSIYKIDLEKKEFLLKFTGNFKHLQVNIRAFTKEYIFPIRLHEVRKYSYLIICTRCRNETGKT